MLTTMKRQILQFPADRCVHRYANQVRCDIRLQDAVRNDGSCTIVQDQGSREEPNSKGQIRLSKGITGLASTIGILEAINRRYSGSRDILRPTWARGKAISFYDLFVRSLSTYLTLPALHPQGGVNRILMQQ